MIRDALYRRMALLLVVVTVMLVTVGLIGLSAFALVRTAAADGAVDDAVAPIASVVRDEAPAPHVAIQALRRQPDGAVSIVEIEPGDRPCGERHGWSVDAETEAGRVVDVVPDSPAAEAGIAPGETITAVDGQTVDAEHTVAELIGAHAPGETVTLELEADDGTTRTADVTLAEHPERSEVGFLGVYLGGAHVRMRRIGPGGMDFELRLPEEMGDVEGALVVGLADDGPAAAAGLEAHDVVTAVDGQALDDPGALSGLLDGYAPGDTVTLTVQRGDTTAREVEVTLGEHPDVAGTAYLGLHLAYVMRRVETDGDGTDVLEELKAPSLERKLRGDDDGARWFEQWLPRFEREAPVPADAAGGSRST